MRFAVSAALAASLAQTAGIVDMTMFFTGFVYGASGHMTTLEATNECISAWMDFGESGLSIVEDVKNEDWFSAYRNWHHFRKMTQDHDKYFGTCDQVSTEMDNLDFHYRFRPIRDWREMKRNFYGHEAEIGTSLYKME